MAPRGRVLRDEGVASIMRPSALLWVAMVAVGISTSMLLGVPKATAHAGAYDGEVLAAGTYLQHTQAWEADLAPNATANESLAFAGAPLQYGWLLVFHAEVEGNITATLEDERWLRQWHWSTGSHQETVELSHSGWPVLQLHNRDATNSSVALYFDQTCDCSGKSLPLNEGPLLFNVDAEAGDEVGMDFTITPVRRYYTTPVGDFNGSMQVEAQLIDPAPGGASYDVVREWTWRGHSLSWDDCRGMGRFHACLDVRFEAHEDGRQVVLLRSSHDMPEWSAKVMPLLSVDDSLRIPSGGWLPIAGLAIGGAWRTRRV